MISNFFRAIANLPRRMFSMSLPMGVALVVALCLLVVFAVALLLTVYSTEPGWLLPWWQALPFVILLLVLIPIVTYYAVAIWLEEDVSEFEDIDAAWKAGIAALEKNGIDLGRTPIFLLFGSQGERHEHNVLRAARLRLAVPGAPSGSKNALHFYASDEAIYLSLTNVGQLSALSSAAARTADELASRHYEGRGEMNPSESAPLRHTVQLADAVASTTSAPTQAKAIEPDRMDDLRGTMMVADLLKTQWIPGEEKSTKTRQPTVILSAEEADRQRRRLRHLCRLLLRGRMPLCPINGAMALLPSDLMTFNDDEAKLVSSAFAADVKAMLDTLMLRFPLGVLVVNLESETGFNELVNRLGREAALHRRFGKGYDLWGKLTPQYLDQLCDCACGAFEGFIYNLYGQKGAVDNPGNRPLYSLLCHIRVHVQPKLARVLKQGLLGPDGESLPDGPLFSGCYFGATGDSEDRQAYVKSVFDLLPEQQGELQWTEAALRRNGMFMTGMYLAIALSIGMIVALAAMFYWK